MNLINEHATVLGNAVINTLTAQGFYLTQDKPEAPKLDDVDQLLFYYSLIKWDMAFNSNLSRRFKNYVYIGVYNWLDREHPPGESDKYIAPDADMNGVAEFFHRHVKSKLKLPLHEHEHLRDVRIGSMVRVYRGHLSFGGMSTSLLRVASACVLATRLFGKQNDVIAEAVDQCPSCGTHMILTFLPECGHSLWVHDTQEGHEYLRCPIRAKWDKVRESLSRSDTSASY